MPCPPGVTSLAGRLGAGVLAWVVAGLLSACASTASGPGMTVAPSAPAPSRSTAGMLRVDFVDVGHGDAVLITSPTGKTVLIDGGPATAGEAVARLVRSRTAAPLDLVLLTHRHSDHLGGLSRVIAGQGARLFMDAAVIHPSPAYDDLLLLLAERHIPVREAVRGRVIELGNDTAGGAEKARLVLLTPPVPLITGSRSDVNANSVVARLEYGAIRMLFTGDAEAITEDWLISSRADLRADVLKLAHHGSRHSSTAPFLAAVRPSIAIVSCGPVAQQGPLREETTARVVHFGARLYRTDRDGTITVWTDGRNITVETQIPAKALTAEGRQ
ncbi:MAG: MBL fold metallo-hydrolase [Myxococcales bacterium]